MIRSRRQAWETMPHAEYWHCGVEGNFARSCEVYFAVYTDGSHARVENWEMVEMDMAVEAAWRTCAQFNWRRARRFVCFRIYVMGRLRDGDLRRCDDGLWRSTRISALLGYSLILSRPNNHHIPVHAMSGSRAQQNLTHQASPATPRPTNFSKHSDPVRLIYGETYPTS